MIKRLSGYIIAAVMLGILLPITAMGQGDEPFRMKLESILYKYKNYRYSTISIYKFKDVKDVRNAIKSKEQKKKLSQNTSGDECVKKADKAAVNVIENSVKEQKNQGQIQRDLIGRGLPIPDDFECIYQWFFSQQVDVTKQIRDAYVITTRMEKGQIEPSTIIAMIVSVEGAEEIKKNIDGANPADTNPELIQFDLDKTEFRASNMYELIVNAFRQNNIQNKTLEAQGIGTLARFAPKLYGVSESLISNESDITSADLQKFIRISDGQADEFSFKKNEFIASPDLISWKKYDINTVTFQDGAVDTLSTITNKQLPKFGIELRYGVDDINYTSLWSERLTAYALWQSVKLGVILPTNGWSSISKDMFDQTRRLTYAGPGLSGVFDFPIKVIPKSGVFHLDFGYVFGNAVASDYKNRGDMTPGGGGIFDPDIYVYDPGDKNFNDWLNNDYLIRMNAQLHYTFGIAIDNDYQLRFGLGGTLYNVETWHYESVKNTETNENRLIYKKGDNQSIGGVSGKIEFMAKNISTPFGASLQYFDESVFADMWFEIPIVTNTLALRIDAKGYFTAFRDKPHPWENSSMFVLMPRFIVSF